MALACFRIIFIYVAQRFENITAGVREVRRHFYKLPAAVREAVSLQNLRAVTQFRGIARQRITHLQRRGEIPTAVLKRIAPVFAGVLAAGELQGDPASLLCGPDAAGEPPGAIVGWLAR